MDKIEPIRKTVEKYIEPILSNKFVEIIVSWIIIISIVYTLEDLPPNVKQIITHPVSKTIITFIAFYTITKKLYMSIGVTVVILSLFYGLKNLKEHFELVWPQTNTYPNCSDIKVKDLLTVFDNNELSLKKAMYMCNIPLNISLNDLNAPLIATYLINYGYKVSTTCQPPFN